jgi:hypothetical protein
MRSREFISWYGDYKDELVAVRRFLRVAFGNYGAHRRSDRSLEHFLIDLCGKWMEDSVRAPNVHLWLWKLHIELGWLLTNVGEPALAHICRVELHGMAPPSETPKPFTSMFTIVQRELDRHLKYRPDATTSDYRAFLKQLHAPRAASDATTPASL